ncbi:MAG TPA: cupredoxin domain-containing protein [Actinomycetota bacterium]
MRASTRDRLVLPILMPVGILVLIGAVLFGFSRILLSVTHDAATATALVVAFGIMVVAGIVASRAVVKPANLASMVGAVAGVAMLAGGIALVALAPGGPGEGGGAGGPVVTLNLVAKGIAFQQTNLSAPAGEPFAIAFDNQDAGIQHDVVIYDNKDFSGDPLFEGDIVTGPAKTTYEVPALQAGTYYFHCSIHPQMQGQIQVAEAPGGGGPAVNVAAEGLKFDTAEIRLTAGTPSTIHFENKDAGVQHNIAIFPSENDLQNPLFRGEIVTGPDSIDYHVPALDPGTYYFHCDIHPTMNGTVVVAESGGGGGGGSPGPTGTPGGGGATTSTVAAEGIAFDTAEIHLPGNQAVTLTFENKDAGIQHNIAIFPSESDLQNPLFRGEIVTGPATTQYQIPALQPGTYYFHCDIHPTMNGTVIVG